MPVPHLFANECGNIKRDYLDDNFAASADATNVGLVLPYAVPYLKTLSALANGDRWNLLLALPEAQRAAVSAYTSTYDCFADIASVFAQAPVSKKSNLYFPDGLFNTSGAWTNWPLRSNVHGAGRRGFGNSAANYAGTILKASGNNGIIALNPGVLTAVDMEIKGIAFLGQNGGTVDGVSFTNLTGIDMMLCVIDFFSRYNLAMYLGAGASYLDCNSIYSARAGVANFYIDAQYCTLTKCSSDSAPTAVLGTVNGHDLSINGRSHFEGATNTGIRLLGNRCRVEDTLINNTAGGIGLFSSGSGLGVTNVQALGANIGSLGLDVQGIEYRVEGSLFSGFSTAGKIENGFGTVSTNVFEGNQTGLELVGGFGVGIITDNTCAGATNSLLHTSGFHLFQIGNNRYDDGAGNYKAPTLTAGDPFFTTGNAGPVGTVASVAALVLPLGTEVINVSGAVNITSVGVAGFTGKTVKLIFGGVLTVVDGGNLKLNGNFTTTADDTLTICCDNATQWFEVGRSVN